VRSYGHACEAPENKTIHSFDAAEVSNRGAKVVTAHALLMHRAALGAIVVGAGLNGATKVACVRDERPVGESEGAITMTMEAAQLELPENRLAEGASALAEVANRLADDTESGAKEANAEAMVSSVRSKDAIDMAISRGRPARGSIAGALGTRRDARRAIEVDEAWIEKHERAGVQWQGPFALGKARGEKDIHSMQ